MDDPTLTDRSAEEEDDAGSIDELLGLTGEREEPVFDTAPRHLDEGPAAEEEPVADDSELTAAEELRPRHNPQPAPPAAPFEEPLPARIDDDPFDDVVTPEHGLKPLFDADGIHDGAPVSPMASLWTSARDGDSDEPDPTHPPYSQQSLAVIGALEKGMDSRFTTELHANGPSRITAKVRGHNVMLHGYAFASTEEYTRFLRDLVHHSQNQVTWEDIERESRGVIAMRDGSRLTVKLPPLSEFPTFSIRKHAGALWTPDRVVAAGMMPPELMAFLRSCVAAHVNILVVGGAGSGKTTLMRTLASDIGDDERIAVIEQVDELRLTKPQTQKIRYIPGTELDLEEALDIELYDSIDRIIVGEVHTHGLGSMLEVMKITHGSLSSYHADSAEDMVARMKVALQKETANMTSETALDDIRQAIELVVVLERVEGQYRCIQVREIDWRSTAGTLSLPGRDLFVWNREEERWDKPNRPDDEGRIVDAFYKWGVHSDPRWHDDEAAFAAMRL